MSPGAFVYNVQRQIATLTSVIGPINNSNAIAPAKQQAMTCINTDQVPCHHTASLGCNQLRGECRPCFTKMLTSEWTGN